MKKIFLAFFTVFASGFACYAQLDVQDSWLRFPSGNGPTFIRENWGLNIAGSNVQPVKVINTSFLVGYTSAGEDLGQGNALISGKVGIGTTSPRTNASLDIHGGGLAISQGIGNLDATLHITGSYGGFDRLTQISPAEAGKPALNLMAARDGSSTDLWWSWGVLTSGTWAFQPATLFGGTTGMFIDRSGSVGIGTTTPREALSVNGNIRSKEVKVETANWPDYVFKPAYNLLSLTEVKAYIEKNQHLPEMPSEQEVAKEGINLGEMNKLLTKKVEELTLYLIEKDKEVKVQASELKQQSEKSVGLESRLSKLEALLAKPAAKN